MAGASGSRLPAGTVGLCAGWAESVEAQPSDCLKRLSGDAGAGCGSRRIAKLSGLVLQGVGFVFANNINGAANRTNYRNQ